MKWKTKKIRPRCSGVFNSWRCFGWAIVLIATIVWMILLLWLFTQWAIAEIKYLNNQEPEVISIEKPDFEITAFKETYEQKRDRELAGLIQCESGGNSFAKNSLSTALGIFQILDGTKALCERNLGIRINRTNDKDSWICARWLYDRYGLKPWQECVDILNK